MKNFKNFNDFSIHVGHGLEHFDMALYGFLVPILAPVFFPDFDPIVQLIASYSLLATSVVTRPLGVLVFGSLSMGEGASRGLAFSLMGLSMATMGLGFLPTYAQWGYMAPLSLLMVRFIQGFFASGESALARLFLLENKNKTQAYPASVRYQWFSMIGIVVASCASFLTVAEGINVSWRLWYVSAGLLGGVIGFMRYRTFMAKDRDIKRLETNNLIHSCKKVPVWVALKAHRKIFLAPAVTTGFAPSLFAFVVFPAFIPMVTSVSLETMLEWGSFSFWWI